MWISRKVYEDLKAEHNKTLIALSDEIEYLRTQLGTPTTRPAKNPTEQPPVDPNQKLYVSEDEETLLDAYANGLIEGPQFQKALEQAGLLNTEIEVNP